MRDGYRWVLGLLILCSRRTNDQQCLATDASQVARDGLATTIMVSTRGGARITRSCGPSCSDYAEMSSLILPIMSVAWFACP